MTEGIDPRVEALIRQGLNSQATPANAPPSSMVKITDGETGAEQIVPIPLAMVMLLGAIEEHLKALRGALVPAKLSEPQP